MGRRRSKRQRVYDHLEAVDQLLNFGAMERMDNKDFGMLTDWLEKMTDRIQLEGERRAKEEEEGE